MYVKQFTGLIAVSVVAFPCLAYANPRLNCTEDLIDAGVSPDTAATQCHKDLGVQSQQAPSMIVPQILPQFIMPLIAPRSSYELQTITSPASSRVLRPYTRAGSWYVYRKPSIVSNDRMNAAGAAYYPPHVACSMHYSFCTNSSGVWLSSRGNLILD